MTDAPLARCVDAVDPVLLGGSVTEADGVWSVAGVAGATVLHAQDDGPRSVDPHADPRTGA